MAVRKLFRFRKFTLKTVLGTTRLKRKGFSLSGVRAIKSPFRKLGNLIRTGKRRSGLERFLPRQVFVAGHVPISGGFLFSKRRSKHKGPSLLSRLLPGSSGAATRNTTRPLIPTVSSRGKDQISFQINISPITKRQMAKLLMTSAQRQQLAQARTVRAQRSAAAKAQKAALAARNAQRAAAAAKGRKTQARRRKVKKAVTVVKTVASRLWGSGKPIAGKKPKANAPSKPKLSKAQIIKNQLLGKLRKGQIKQIFYPSKPPTKGKRRK